MKVLAVSDLTWVELVDALSWSEAGKDVLDRLGAIDELPDRNELLLASVADAETPEVFAQAVERRDALAAAAESARLRLAELIRRAKALDVPPSALARWTGYAPRTIHDIVSEEEVP